MTSPSQTGAPASWSILQRREEPPQMRPAAVDTPTLGYDETLGPATSPAPVPGAMPSGSRSTVLPRVQMKEENVTLIHAPRTRFTPLKALGAGGVGEVELLHDEDIQRPVALKRLRSDRMSEEGVARFVEEIRTVGQLEHPNIVPIHDVGIDEKGRYYFMMKYVDGETLDTIIQKLHDGDPGYHARFPFPVRTQLFLSILQAVAYAHANGVIHRDLKPANIMVGRFGEVMVMDWGLARRVKDRELPVVPTEREDPQGLQTRQDTLLGTPAYMAPEQARGDNAAVDERSDIYALSVMFHELLTLRHYLAGAADLQALLRGVASVEAPVGNEHKHPHQSLPPVELCYVAQRGMHKDPAKRWASVAEMMAALQDIQRGDIKVVCQITALKRATHALLRFMDAHPRVTIVGSTAMVCLAVAGLVQLIL